MKAGVTAGSVAGGGERGLSRGGFLARLSYRPVDRRRLSQPRLKEGDKDRVAARHDARGRRWRVTVEGKFGGRIGDSWS
jgi:hypothetical protein